MTPERAEHIARNRLMGGALRYSYVDGYAAAPREDMTRPDGITREENEFILDVWRRMPGYTCYFDALMRIANRTHTVTSECLDDIRRRVEREG